MIDISPDWPTILAELAKHFPPEALHWRVGSISHDQKTAQALPYADTRAYEDRLNTVCPDAWTVTYHPWGDTRIICNLTIHNLTRSSTGEPGTSPNDIAGTSAEAQAFKRACSKFGLGRYLYSVKPRWVTYDANRKRFLEEPVLEQDASEGPAQAVEGRQRLGAERGQAMRQQLAALGMRDARRQCAFAARVIRKPVLGLQELTQDEARAVWKEARRLERAASAQAAS